MYGTDGCGSVCWCVIHRGVGHNSLSATMQVYKVNFVLAAENTVHTTYIHATNAKDSLQKLSERFPGEPREIHIESIAEDHGKFVIGAEERDFSE